MAAFDRNSRSTTATAALTTSSMLIAGAGAGVLGAALLATPAGAAAYSVTNTDDSGAGSLRSAITNANSNPGIDTITFSGVTSGTITLESDLPAITEGVVISGPGSGAITISGNDSFHAFTVDTSGSGAVTISGLTIAESFTTGTGGAIDVHNTGLTLDDMVLVDNSAVFASSEVAGGALFVDNLGSDFDITISNSMISGNEARNTTIELGALDPSSSASGPSLGGGASLSARNITLTNVTISDNESFLGGGLFTGATGNIAIRNSSITSNYASRAGGGIVSQSEGSISIISSDISGNVAHEGAGGGYLQTYGESSQTLISNSRISDNVAEEIGGLALIQPYGNSLIENSTITGNVGRNIGGLAQFYSGVISSSTISNNVGAGVSVGSPYASGPVSLSAAFRSPVVSACSLAPEATYWRDVSATITNSTVSGNTREGIGANIPLVFDYGSTPTGVALSRSTSLADCEAPEPQQVSIGLVHVLSADNGLEDVAAPAISLFSLIERPNAGVLAGYGTQTGVDPMLQPLEFVNRTVSVVPIHANSPAWDAGYPGFVPPPATDQRGLPRVVQIIDIGAYEVQEIVVQPKFTG
jgi:hypothetical protein